MSRRVVVAFAVFAALLVASAMPVGALQTNTAVGSIHTNETDFNAATTLENATVEGSGGSASVSANFSFVDDFEDGSIADYEGQSGSFSVQSTNVFSGSNAVRKTSNDGSQRGMFLDREIYAAGDQKNLSGWRYYSGSGDERGGIWLTESDGTGYLAYFAATSSNTQLSLRRTNSDTDIGTQLDSAGTGSQSAEGWYQVFITQDGNTITAEVRDESGDQVLSTSATDSNENPTRPGVWAFDTGTDFDLLEDQTEGVDRAIYVSQTHSVDNASAAFTNVTLSNASAEVTWLADTNGDGTFGTTAASSTFTTTGNHSLDISGTDSTDWRVNVTLVSTGSSPSAELHDEGVQFTNHEPQIDNSSASPTGQLSSGSQSLSIDVSDIEFGSAQGDSVDVEFFVDGNSVGTDTITANGTASVSHTFTGGDHTWSATATDSYGLSNSSQAFSVTAPANVTIREEEEPHDIVKSATATVVISGSGETVDRQTVTDGNVSLSGLPTDESYAIVVNATGYHPRAILVDDLFEQTDVFVLNESRASVENTFIIEDRSGNFPPSQTNLIIEKPINSSLFDPSGATEYQWMTISGDRLGADQSLVVALEDNGRYRLAVENQDGDRRVLGEYSAASAGTVELRIGNVEVTPDESGTYAYDANFTTLSGSKFVKFQFNDPDDATTDLRLVIHEYGNATNEIENSTHSGPFGTFSFTEDLTAISSEAENTTWVVEFTATRNGEEITGSRVVGRSGIGTGVPIAPMWLHVGSVGFLILIAGLVGGLVNPGAGAASVASVAGVLWYMELLPAEIGGGAIALALLVSAGWIVATQGGSFR